jgi:hypothetical protein
VHVAESQTGVGVGRRWHQAVCLGAIGRPSKGAWGPGTAAASYVNGSFGDVAYLSVVIVLHGIGHAMAPSSAHVPAGPFTKRHWLVSSGISISSPVGSARDSGPRRLGRPGRPLSWFL